MELTGLVIETETLSGKTKTGKEWKKKLFVIEYRDGMYPRQVAFELFGEDTIKNNPVRKGQKITVSYNLESRKWKEQWFTSAMAWRVEPAKTQDGEAPKTETAQAQATDFIEQDESEGLPF